LKCPLCEQQLVPQQLAGITVDVCSSCIGIWFDPGEFGAYGQMTGSALADALKAFKVDGSEPARECPRCRTVAVELGLAGNHPLYRCAGCTGAFLISSQGRSKAVPAAEDSKPKDRLSKEVMQHLLSLLHELLDHTEKPG